MTRKRKIIGFLLVFLFLVCTVMALYFSSQPSDVSNQQSKTAVKVISSINDIFDITDTGLYLKVSGIVNNISFFDKYKTPNSLVRKSAHFGIYFLLGMISTGFGYVYSGKMLIGFLLGISLPVTVAVLDEFNQSFVGRTSSLTDVLIDGIGALTGAFLVTILILAVVIIISVKRYLTKKPGG